MKYLFLTLLSLCTFQSFGKLIVQKSRDNGFLWHYDKVYQEQTGDVIKLVCTDPGAQRCRPIDPGVPSIVVNKMDITEATIEQSLNNQILS